MKVLKQICATYESYASVHDLQDDDYNLLEQARLATDKSYAPYSKFFVGAAARLQDNTIISGGNQENASYPVGICAERVVLSAVSASMPQAAVMAMAIYVKSAFFQTSKPSGPCGMCRQSLLEVENRFKLPIRLILGAEKGETVVFYSIRDLLPYLFDQADLKLPQQTV